MVDEDAVVNVSSRTIVFESGIVLVVDDLSTRTIDMAGPGVPKYSAQVEQDQGYDRARYLDELG